jgi:hypothetical protein
VTTGTSANTANTAGLYASGAGAITEAYSAYASAAAAKSNLQFKSKLDKIAAAREEERAGQVARRGADRLFKLRLQQSQMEGEQRVLLAAQGLDVTEGSAARLLEDTKYISDLDAAALEDNTSQEIRMIRESARMKLFDSAVNQGAADQISPALAGATSAVAGAGKLAERWYSYQSGRPSGTLLSNSGYTGKEYTGGH